MPSELKSLYQTLFTEDGSLADFALDLKQEHAFRSISTLFRQNGVLFCPLKGADLAWRVYPKGLLRPKCDLDILIRPEEVNKVLSLLKAEKWQMPYRYRTQRHEAMLFRHGVALEVHFNLPGSRLAPDAVWQEMIREEACCCRLPLELNLLMLFNHTMGHHWFNGRRLVMDCACLIQKEGCPDWDQVRVTAERFGMISPALLFAAFPECFPAAAQPAERYADEVCEAFRTLILNSLVPLEGVQERVMTAERRDLHWWLARLHGMGPSSIRIQTGNPEGHYGRLFLGYWQVAWCKLKTFFCWRPAQMDPAVRRRLQHEMLVENALKSTSSQKKG